MFTDTHTHLYDEAFTDDLDAVISRAVRAGVTKMIVPDTDSSVRNAMFDIVRSHPDLLHAAVGLHPEEIRDNWKEELALAGEAACSESICAIGEIGLDYHWSTEFRDEQLIAFKEQLKLADRLDLPVIIHCRDAVQDILGVLREMSGLNLRGVFHAFSGSLETFNEIQKYGDWYVGIGGVLTFRNAGIAKTLKDIPLERIVLETDSPYLTPVPHRGERNESCFIPIIAEKISEVKDVPLKEIEEVTSRNADCLFNLSRA